MFLSELESINLIGMVFTRIYIQSLELIIGILIKMTSRDKHNSNSKKNTKGTSTPWATGYNFRFSLYSKIQKRSYTIVLQIIHNFLIPFIKDLKSKSVEKKTNNNFYTV